MEELEAQEKDIRTLKLQANYFPKAIDLFIWAEWDCGDKLWLQ